MSAWPELPRPATPGPWGTVEPMPGYGHPWWTVDHIIGPEDDPEDEPICAIEKGPEDAKNAAAIAALPDYVAEVDRLRAWLEFFAADNCYSHGIEDVHMAAVRAGEWPEGREP